jgi:hypothetical protein
LATAKRIEELVKEIRNGFARIDERLELVLCRTLVVEKGGDYQIARPKKTFGLQPDLGNADPAAVDPAKSS